MKRQQTHLITPWSLHFDRDGTDDVAIICDANRDDLVHSRHFWMPEGNDPIPPTLAAMRVMVAAPKMLQALQALTATARTFRNVPKKQQAWTSIDDVALNAAFAARAEATGGAA